MNASRRCLATSAVLLAVVMLIQVPAAAWHGEGHGNATRLAVASLPDDVPAFFRASGEAVAHCALDPDLFCRPIGPAEVHGTERPEHYIDLERLKGGDIPATRYELLKWAFSQGYEPGDVGLLPHAIVEWTQRLSVAFAEHRRWPANEHVQMKCFVYAGILAHYAEDLCQPLHTTIHYDGRAKADGSSSRTGIHQKVDALLGKLAPNLLVPLDPDQIQPFESLFSSVVSEVKASHALLDRVYQLEAQYPDTRAPMVSGSEVERFTSERMQASAKIAARLMLTAWRDSAKIRMPDWHHRAEQASMGLRAGLMPIDEADDVKPAPAGGEMVRLASYNVEHFMRMFDQHRMPQRSQSRDELFRDEEDQFEVARTMRLEQFNADIIAIQECCSEDMLRRFSDELLTGQYAFVKVFPGNTDGQYLGMLARPGFEVLAVRDEYHREADSVDDPAVRRNKERSGLADGNLLFSRGPAFVKFRTPGGKVLWVGCTHIKSKSGNNAAVTRWRIREIERTRQICGELIAEGGSDGLVMLGDFNDDFGMDRYEQEVDTDAVSVMLQGEADEKMTSPTRKYVRRHPAAATYHCEIKPPTYRSFIDHAFVSASLGAAVRGAHVVDDPIAAVASDHYPIVTVLHFPQASATALLQRGLE
jgi:endonuclease/exonuclease/phosphatase family metal-dependent hydrolase